MAAQKKAEAEFDTELQRIGVTWGEQLPKQTTRDAERQAAYVRYQDALRERNS